MKTLADKVHKQGEHIPQLIAIYISHNHPYISSSDMLTGTISIYSRGGGTGGAGGASAPPKISVGEHCSPFQQLLFCK